MLPANFVAGVRPAMPALPTEAIVWAQRYIEYHLRDKVLSADALHEVVLKLWIAVKIGKPLTLAYVRAVCDSVLADHYRACLRQPPCVSLETCAEYAVVEAGYEAVENRLLLEQALAQLSERDRAIVAMHYLDELPFEQIGQALGISTECAKKACQRAIAKLQRWAKECGE